jgi:predicted GH43/DUF377 family glycosyl hydrolase
MGSFVDHLTEDPERNQRLWRRRPEPVIGKVQPWCGEFLAPSTVLVEGDLLVMYVEGSGHGKEQIGVFTCPVAGVERQAWVPHPDNPILGAGGRGAFDRGSVFDPSVVGFGGRYLLYYSATTGDAHRFAAELLRGDPETVLPSGETIGLAAGDGPFRFSKVGENPVMDGRCPHPFVWRGRVFLYFLRVAEGGYRIHLAVSDDGVHFAEAQEQPVLLPGDAGEWDSRSVTTPCVFSEGGAFYMLYAGDAESLDDPTGIGVAVSTDLVRWEKLAGNPIFVTGEPGRFDSASVAGPRLKRFDDTYFLWYAGSDRKIRDGLNSQIGVALMPSGTGSERSGATEA